jgi:hypothetical protein
MPNCSCKSCDKPPPLRHVADAVVVDEHGEQVAQLLLQPSFAFSLSRMATFCAAGMAGFTKRTRAARRCLPRWRENRRTGGRWRPCRAWHRSPHRKGAGVAGNKGGHLVLPSLACGRRRPRRQQTRRSGRDRSPASEPVAWRPVDGQIGGKVRRPRRAWAAATPISCSAAATMRALSSLSAALMRFSSSRLSCSTWARNFAISSPRPASLASTALRRDAEVGVHQPLCGHPP